jgi:hypothetical protein
MPGPGDGCQDTDIRPVPSETQALSASRDETGAPVGVAGVGEGAIFSAQALGLREVTLSLDQRPLTGILPVIEHRDGCRLPTSDGIDQIGVQCLPRCLG